MPSSAHDVDWAEPLLERVARLDGATLEVGVHPGENEPWRIEEGASIVSFATQARERGHELVPWSRI